MRKPSKMPRLTHAFVCQLPSASRSAARISPRLSAVLNFANNAKSSLANSPPSRAANSSISSRSGMNRLQQTKVRDHFTNTRPTLFLNRYERQSEIFFQQSHHRHRRLHRARARFDEVNFHQRQQLVM